MDARARRREQTRQQILEAAWRLAERDGIAGLALRDLAREVGMRAPSLYTYFESKSAIYDAMFEQGYREALELFDGSLAADEDPVDGLARHLEEFIDFCEASLPRYQLMFTRVLPDWQPSAEAYAPSVALLERMQAHLETLGMPGRESLDLWTALTSGLVAQQLANDPGGDRWRGLARDVAHMFVHHHARSVS